MTNEEAYNLQYQDYFSEEDEILNNFNSHYPWGDDIQNSPHGKEHINLFDYDIHIDMTEYNERYLHYSFISPKYLRLQLHDFSMRRARSPYQYRLYNNPKFIDHNRKIDPAKDIYNEEKQEFVKRASPLYNYWMRLETKSSDREIREFLEQTLENELENSQPESISEELIDQALYEAQYIKKGEDNDEYQKLKKRNPLEIKEMMKAIGFDPYDNWMDPPGKDNMTHLGHHFYIDKLQRVDPLYHILSEIQHPIILKHMLEEWRRGAEIRFKMPYYPEEKPPSKSFDY